MTTAVPADKTSVQDIDGLLSGTAWELSNITFSFPGAASHYGNNYGSGEPQKNFQPLTAAHEAAVREALGMISSVTELSFSEVQETATNHATLRFGSADIPAPAWTYSPGATPTAGDTWFRTSGGLFGNPAPGGYAYYVVIHEVAHAVGLKHGNESHGFGAMTAPHDSMEHSVMTYRSYAGADGHYVENETWGFAQSLMAYDIAALQHLYGADYTTNSRDSTYRWDPVTGETFVNGAGQGPPGDNRVFMTVWDGGGVDVYDFARYTSNLVVDLGPGQWSRTSEMQIAELGYRQKAVGNIANALLYQGDPRSLIENAIGGSGDDRILGNAAANLIKGRTGDDRIFGLEGNDVLYGGPGRDVIAAGPGKDTIVFDSTLKKSVNLDWIRDFVPADDTIFLQNSVFTKVGHNGKLASSLFWKGSKAHDPSDRIIYNTKTGALLYDKDGTGEAPHIQFAKLAKGLKMSAADFHVI